MGKTVLKLTVCFEEPFWVGFCQRQSEGGYEVCKITFGAEPKDYQVYDFIQKNYDSFRFSPALEADVQADRHINPKRMQRKINKQLQCTGIGTKAQQALKSCANIFLIYRSVLRKEF